MEKPFNVKNMKQEKISNSDAVEKPLDFTKLVVSDENLTEDEQEEAMEIYSEIADIFIRRNVSLDKSFLILMCLVNSIYEFAVFGDKE